MDVMIRMIATPSSLPAIPAKKGKKLARYATIARAIIEIDGGSSAQKVAHPYRKANGLQPALFKYT
ncbi:hypothetical protein D3C75_853230 [compost metagenome]